MDSPIGLARAGLRRWPSTGCATADGCVRFRAMAKLWDKGYGLDELVETFTVGNDYVLDLDLLPADAVCSIAHVKTLRRAGILEEDVAAEIVAALSEVVAAAGEGRFPIGRDQEDGHTAIEAFLTDRLGDAGKRVHTGRSRNDQVLTALRLYTKDSLLQLRRATLSLADRFAEFAERHAAVPMVGRTHLQPAMPSTVGLWADHYAALLEDDAAGFADALRRTDRCPLGAAAGYGVPLDLDREYTARILGFREAQDNVIAAIDGRGKEEASVIAAVVQTALTLSRFAQDVILFSLPEVGYFRLDQELCSGSSIMPQKRNPDIFELMRARCSRPLGYLQQVASLTIALPSGYNRDVQDTKEPLLRSLADGIELVAVAQRGLEGITVDEDALRRGFHPGVFATDAALERVAAGIPFRDAYREVAESIELLTDRDPATTIGNRTALGTAGNLRATARRSRLARDLAELGEAERHFHERVADLAGGPVRLRPKPGGSAV